jgi:hypothetical protein
VFESHCNRELVELEEPSEEDFTEVRALVAEHLERTGSTVAERTLAQWDELRPAWVKVMPMDYKRALRELAEKQAVEAGEFAVVGERGDGSGAGPVTSGQPAPAGVADGDQAARDVGEAGQYEDASVAAERGGEAARDAGAGAAEQAQAADEAQEEVLPGHG